MVLFKKFYLLLKFPGYKKEVRMSEYSQSLSFVPSSATTYQPPFKGHVLGFSPYMYFYPLTLPNNSPR